MRTTRAPRAALSFLLAASVSCNSRPGDPSLNTGASVPAPGGGTGGGSTSCATLETRAPNATGQRPAFHGQTRACAAPSNVPFAVTVVTKELQQPWAVEPLPSGDLLVTEKAGRLRIVSASGTVGQPIVGLPSVDARGQGGLLDVALSPDFTSDRTIFWSFSEPRPGGNGTSIARGVLSADRTTLGDVRVIFRVLPAYGNNMHFGSRLAFGPDGMLYATFGERSDVQTRPYAQRLDSHLGKIVRIRRRDALPAAFPSDRRSQ